MNLAARSDTFVDHAVPRFASRQVGRITTAVHSDSTAFDKLQFEWDELLDDSEQSVFFLRRRWNQLWWQYYAPPDSRLNLITCRDESGRLVGLAPFYWRRHRFLRIPCARELLFLGMGIELKSSEHMDVIARRGAETAVADAIAEWLRSSGSWDRLWLWQVPHDSLVLPLLTRSLGRHARVEICDHAPYIDTSTDWETFKAGFGRSMRRNVEYYARRLFRLHSNSEFRRVTRVDELEPAIDALVRLHQARWNSKGERGAFFYKEFDSFLREAIRHAFATGKLGMWTLSIDGRIEGALVGFLDNGVLHYFQKGFNPTFAKAGLGTALLALCLRDCFEDPQIRTFDFMGGGAAYKELWARCSRENLVYEVQRVTVGTAIFTVRQRLNDLASAAYRRLVPDHIRVARREWMRRSRLTSNSMDFAPAIALWLSETSFLEALTRFA